MDKQVREKTKLALVREHFLQRLHMLKASVPSHFCLSYHVVSHHLCFLILEAADWIGEKGELNKMAPV